MIKVACMFAAPIQSLTLTDFRSYAAASLDLSAGSVFLFGPNGAGKTNVLEAVSWLAPGRGLRGAPALEAGRRLPGESIGRAWAVSAGVSLPDTPAAGDDLRRIGTGLDGPGGRRVVRIDGQPAQPGRLSEFLRLVWLTPAHDRLFIEGAAERRRFLDRLVFADDPAHAREVNAYERALRERLRLLTAEGAADPAWLDALEAQAAEAGAQMAFARARTVAALTDEIGRRSDRPFPLARLGLTGPFEQAALAGEPFFEVVEALRTGLSRSRPRDAAAGRSLTGPHRTDLAVTHVDKDRPAAECSTGEQKAMLLNIVLAQAARLARDPAAPPPVLLLDEVAAHLDRTRRVGLYRELEELGLQAFLTGVEAQLFDGLTAASGLRVEDGALFPA
jgi:DNA replication and repair protein RecF